MAPFQVKGLALHLETGEGKNVHAIAVADEKCAVAVGKARGLRGLTVLATSDPDKCYPLN